MVAEFRLQLATIHEQPANHASAEPDWRPGDRGGVVVVCSLRDPKVLLPTIIAGLQTYFDRALGANLLYRFERPQYAEIRKQYVTGQNVIVGQEKEMSTVYGAEHLLRMLGASPLLLRAAVWR